MELGEGAAGEAAQPARRHVVKERRALDRLRVDVAAEHGQQVVLALCRARVGGEDVVGGLQHPAGAAVDVADRADLVVDQRALELEALGQRDRLGQRERALPVPNVDVVRERHAVGVRVGGVRDGGSLGVLGAGLLERVGTTVVVPREGRAHAARREAAGTRCRNRRRRQLAAAAAVGGRPARGGRLALAGGGLPPVRVQQNVALRRVDARKFGQVKRRRLHLQRCFCRIEAPRLEVGAKAQRREGGAGRRCVADHLVQRHAFRVDRALVAHAGLAVLPSA